MKKIILIVLFLGMIVVRSFAQLIDEQNVTVTMDLQPVLQLNMTTPDQINFVFNTIPEYYAGIIQYGATILDVSSSVTWDLYACGTAQAGTNWDLQMAYNGGATGLATSVIPVTALELHQYPINNYDVGAAPAFPDYNTAFAPSTGLVFGQNSIWPSATPYVPPTDVIGNGKYLEGMQGTTLGEGAPGGSYMTGGTLATNYYHIAIDYRILPGLPAVFPAAGLCDGTTYQGLDSYPGATTGAFAAPGVYTMDVKYVLLQDQ
jgi:hypothetical protein